MPDKFVNLDSAWLQKLATDLILESNTGMNMPQEERAARLLQIARNLQGMDEKLGSAYGQGFTEGKLSTLARSNVVSTSRPVSPNLAHALETFKGEVTKLPPEVKAEHNNTLTVDDLDLDF